MALPWLGTLAALTIIGIPIALVFWSMPALCMILMMSWLIAKLLPIPGIGGMIVAAIVALSLLTASAFFLNRGITQDAYSYVLDDKNKLTGSFSNAVIALRQKTLKRNRNDTTVECGAFCLRMLIKGHAKRFLVSPMKNPHDPVDRNATATEFSIQRLGQCPSTKFSKKVLQLKTDSDRISGISSEKAIETMNSLASRGECLVSRDVKLGEADVIISRGRLVRPAREPSRTGFSFFAKTNYVDRITVHQFSADKNLIEERFRWTGVEYSPFIPILLPGPLFGTQLDARYGWLKVTRLINLEGRYDDRIGWPDFLTDTLKLNLSLENAGTE